MKAATTRRPWRPACASTLPMKWTAAPPGGMQHRSDSGLNAFMGIGDDQLDAAQARRASLCKNSVQKVSASDGPVSMPSTSRRPSLLTPTATITATDTMRPLSRTFT